MRLTEQLIRVAEAYAAHRGISLARVSTLVFNAGARLPKIKAGEADLATGSFEDALLWFSRSWPDALPWPEGVARPSAKPPSVSPCHSPAPVE